MYFDPELLKHLIFIGTAFGGPFTAAFQPSSSNIVQPPFMPVLPPPFRFGRLGRIGITRFNLDFTDAAWQVPPPDVQPPPPVTGGIFLTAMSKIQQSL